MFAKQRFVHRSKPCCQNLKHFDNVFITAGNNIVEIFESFTVSQFTKKIKNKKVLGAKGRNRIAKLGQGQG